MTDQEQVLDAQAQAFMAMLVLARSVPKGFIDQDKEVTILTGRTASRARRFGHGIKHDGRSRCQRKTAKQRSRYPVASQPTRRELPVTNWLRGQ